MTTEFETDLRESLAELAATRAELRTIVEPLGDGDLERARRGEWTVATVLSHLAGTDYAWVRMASLLRGREAPERRQVAAPASVAAALETLDASRAAFLAVIEGVDEETFYDLRKIEGFQEASVVSSIRDLNGHEHEHLGQLRATL